MEIIKKRELPKTITIPRGITLLSSPNKIELFGEWYELTIPIGKDHTATLLIDVDALRAMFAIDPEINIG